MSIIDDLKNLFQEKSTTWTYAEIRPERTPIGLMNDPFIPDQHYMTGTVRSFRIPDVRTLFTKFYGTVHSYAEVMTGTGDTATFQTVTTPDKLQAADPNHLDRTIVQNIPVLGPVPFTGGNFVIQIGVFAMKESEMTGPYLDLLGTVAKTAGIAFMSQAVALAQPILTGIDQVVQVNSGGLQIGLYKGVVQPETPKAGYYAIIGAPAGTIDTSNLAIDNAERLVYFDSRQEIDFAYLVFTLERFTTRTDFKQIPEVKKGFAAVIAAEQSGDRVKITDAMSAFKVTVGACQDLLLDDRATVIGKVQAEVDKFLSLLPPPHPSQLDKAELKAALLRIDKLDLIRTAL